MCRAALLIFAIASPSWSQDLASPEPTVNVAFDSKEASAARLAHMTKHARSFTGRREPDDAKIIPVEKPLLRWSNRQSNINDGVFAAWVDEQGRPMAMGQICLVPNQTDQWCIELQSLTSEKFQLEAEFNGPWRPRSPGVQWRPVGHEIKTPAKTEALRLIQMRNFARKFRCDDLFESDGSELRLLTTPLLRYKDPDKGLVDGAMFAMVVHGTDPELIILIELREGDAPDPAKFYYALAPMTAFELNVNLNGEKVWHKPKMTSNLDTDVFWQRQLLDSAPPRRGFFQRLLGL